MSEKLIKSFEGAENKPFKFKYLRLSHSMSESNQVPSPQVGHLIKNFYAQINLVTKTRSSFFTECIGWYYRCGFSRALNGVVMHKIALSVKVL